MNFAPDQNTAEMGLGTMPASRSPRNPACGGSSDSDLSSAAENNSLPSEKVIDPDEFMFANCRYYDNSDEYRPGWARLAAIQDQFSNMDMFRDFSYATRRLMLYRMGRFAFLCNKLEQFEREHGEHLKCLTKNQTRPPGHPPILDNDYDVLIAALGEEEAAYNSLCARHREMRQLHPVPREQYKELLNHMAENGMLDREAYVWMDRPDEMVSTSTPLPPWVIRFLYSPLGKWFIKKISRPRGADPYARSLPEGYQLAALKALQVAGAAALVFVPVGVLWLGELGRPQAFGVVAGCTTVSGAVVAATQYPLDTHKTLGALCAYMAVMVVFAAASSTV